MLQSSEQTLPTLAASRAGGMWGICVGGKMGNRKSLNVFQSGNLSRSVGISEICVRV